MTSSMLDRTMRSSSGVEKVASVTPGRTRAAQVSQPETGSTRKCTVAYFHHPRFSSGWHGGDTRITGLWRVMYEGGVDLVLAGHDHHYERFEPLNPQGAVDTTAGIVQLLAGTGGGALRNLRNTIAPHSAFRLQGHFGVIKLTLGKEEWRSAFIDTNGTVWDPSGGKCH